MTKNLEVQRKWIDASIKEQRAQVENSCKENPSFNYAAQFEEVEDVFRVEFDRLLSFYLFPNTNLMEAAFASDVF